MARRQHEVTRIEGFSDAVFGFALTLLVVSLGTANSDAELMLLVRRSVPFAVTFAMVCYIWWEHNAFFRRYGLQDAWTAFLNSVLLFVVLFYVYPLKYLATALLGAVVHLPPAEIPRMGQPRSVMLLYSSGVVLIFGLFVLLYRHAWSKRAALQLSPEDETTLRFKQRAHVISTALGVIVDRSRVGRLRTRLMWIPGVLYGLMGPLHGWNGYMAGKAQTRLSETS